MSADFGTDERATGPPAISADFGTDEWATCLGNLVLECRSVDIDNRWACHSRIMDQVQVPRCRSVSSDAVNRVYPFCGCRLPGNATMGGYRTASPKRAGVILRSGGSALKIPGDSQHPSTHQTVIPTKEGSAVAFSWSCVTPSTMHDCGCFSRHIPG